VDLRLLAVQQVGGLGDVGHVGRTHHHRVHQLAIPVRANVRFHPEIPLMALLGLVHLRVAFALGILGRGRRGAERGVHQRAFAQQQPARGPVALMALKRPLHKSCISSR